MQTKNRVVVISSSLSQPRHVRRARSLYEIGLDVSFYGFNRPFYNISGIAAESIPFEVRSLGYAANQNFSQRIKNLIKAYFSLRDAERGKPVPSCVYTFSLDCFLLARFKWRSRTRFVYEIGDLPNPDGSSRMSFRFVDIIDYQIIKRSEKVVVTSPYFITEHYGKLKDVSIEKFQIIENRLPIGFTEQFPREHSLVLGNPIRVGWIGAFTSPYTIYPLLTLAADFVGRYDFHFFGDGRIAGEISAAANSQKNIFYHGPYRNPQDLPRVYGSIDLCYGVYDDRKINVRVALPNKLYECAYFGVPLVVAEGTCLERELLKFGFGYAVKAGDIGQLKRFFDALDSNKLLEKKRIASDVSVSKIVHGDSYLSMLSSLVQNTEQRS